MLFRPLTALRLATVLVLSILISCQGEEVRELKLATGSEAGTNHALGCALARAAKETKPRLMLSAETSAGSVENIERLESGAADLAIVQNDTPGSGKVRSVAVLFEDVLHVIVRKGREGSIRRLNEVARGPFSVGPEGSGTAAVAKGILAHVGVPLDKARCRHLPLEESVDALEKGELDTIFVLAAPPFDGLREILTQGRASLMSLADPEAEGSVVDGIRTAYPYLSRAVIAAGTYGTQPERPVGTLGVKAILAARHDVDRDAIRDLTRTLFNHKAELTESHAAAASLSESFDAAALRFPVHDGAARYYRRDEPGFFVAYAEAISLGMTLVVGLGSGLLALREWLKRRKKNRIDRYYAEIEAISERAVAADPDEARELIAALQEIRHRAFGELMRERLEPDSSFVIFQDYLTGELQTLRTRI